MPDKKIPVGAAADDISPEAEHRLEVKIDKMLDPRQPSDTPVDTTATPRGPGVTPPPIDIFNDLKTAPDVPKSVLKTMVGADAVSSKPKPITQLAAQPAPQYKWANKGAANDSDDPLQDDTLDIAVDDISHRESDENLAAQDAELAKAFQDPGKKHGRIRRFFGTWWHNRKARYATVVIVLLAIIALAVLPVTRSFALNTVGVRATATVTVLDDTTQLPLQNAQVSLGGATVTSDADGKVSLRQVKLGSQQLQVSKVAFATATKSVQVALGSNALGTVALKAVGAQYHFKVVDYLSGKPVTTAQAVSGQASAQADKNGLIVLTVKNGDSNDSQFDVSISADGYLKTKVPTTIGVTDTKQVSLLLDKQEVYISKQSGKYDVYKSNIDGANKQLLLAGTGTETSDVSLVISPSGESAALVSSRDNLHDSGGYLLQALTVIDVASGTARTIDHSEKIQLVDWVGNHLVYAEAKAGASAANASRYQLMSYDYQNNQRLLLDHANYFNDIVSAEGSIYYATSNQYAGGVSQFNRIGVDGTGKQTILNDEVWNIFRTDYNDFALSSATSWYTYKLGDSKVTPTDKAYSGTGRFYLDSPDGKQSVWVDNRDGKGALVVYDKASGQERIAVEQSGLTGPVRWLDNGSLVFRVKTSQESADYAVSLVQGATAKKITDVTNASGLGPWYYYQ